MIERVRISSISNGVRKALRASVGRVIARVARPAIEAALENDNRNIARARQRIALAETAEFVEANMPFVKSFASGAELLRVALAQVRGDGLVCEFGVFSGTSMRIIANALPDRKVYGFDSFEGLPEDWFDGMPRGTFMMDQLPKVPSNVTLVKGWFSDTIGPFLQEHAGPAAMLHIDCDLYSSTKCVFEHFEPRIVSGTVIVFDEYFNYTGWKQGEFRAFSELAERAKLTFEYIGYCRYREQVALRVL